ncbi:MAG TPA: PstS family phosphate ABC transporter substrate-binding protein [Solirubrobacterales bacterium]|nr:PstS family phosphate ABC transporter substrate-binding protein [Solirubrobacterales bacterium]
MTSRFLTSAAAFAFATAIAMAALAGTAAARDQIQIVGSSTVFPFATAVAEQFGQKGDFRTPVVESTGTGGGIKLFCSGVGENTPDVANASRRMNASELEACRAAGVTPVEVQVGFDGIVLANAKSGPALNLTREQVFRALAKQVPDETGALQPNPHRSWSDIDPSLPDARIEVLGPPPTSGTRDAFVELVMEAACPEAVKSANEDACGEIREDGAYIEAGENDNLIVQKLEANPAAVGIFGFSFLDQNADRLKGGHVDGVEPTFENIAAGDYPVSRSLYFYLKKEHMGHVPGLQEYAAEFTSEDAWGEEGYLAEKGLIPLSPEEREQYRAAAEALDAVAM